jgi:hypothetical protein
LDKIGQSMSSQREHDSNIYHHGNRLSPNFEKILRLETDPPREQKKTEQHSLITMTSLAMMSSIGNKSSSINVVRVRDKATGPRQVRGVRSMPAKIKLPQINFLQRQAVGCSSVREVFFCPIHDTTKEHIAQIKR